MALTDSLIAYWKLDETSGTRNDAHGSNHLTDNNTVPLSGTGKISGGADFTRADADYLSIADNTDMSLGTDTDFTWSLWFKPKTIGILQILFIKNGNFVGATTSEYQLYADSSDRLNFAVGNNSTAGELQTGSVLSVGTWIYIVCWHSSTDDKLYLQTNNGTPTELAWSGGTYDGTEGFALSNKFGITAWALDGVLDEVGFWKRVLNAGERTQLYNSGAGLAYPFAGGALPFRSPRLNQAVERAGFF